MAKSKLLEMQTAILVLMSTYARIRSLGHHIRSLTNGPWTRGIHAMAAAQAGALDCYYGRLPLP